jgi:hypothetical protein
LNEFVKFTSKETMKKSFNIIFILVLILLPLNISLTQEVNSFNRSDRSKHAPVQQSIFSDIEKGLSSGNVSVISRYFSPQTYFSLSNGVSGYYSSNQSFYILEDFFSIYKVSSFRFLNIQADKNNPYATGVYTFESKGQKGTSQVYVSLKNIGGSWKITQITIN